MLIKKGPKYGEKLNNAWQGSIEIIRDIASLFALELRLAGRNLIIIGMLTVLIILFLLTVWLSFSFIIMTWFMSYGFSVLSSLAMLIILNLLLIVLSGILILVFLKHVDFRETRQQIHLLIEEKNE